MLTAVLALLGVILIAVSAFPVKSRVGLFAIGVAVFLLGWAVLPMFGIH